MSWSPQQAAALDMVAEFLRDPSRQTFYMAGYAGTGKTTLAKHIAQQSNGRTVFCAFTGKAAHVMRRSGCPDASTIHSLIYHTHEKSKNRLHELRDQLTKLEAAENKDADLITQVKRQIEKERERLKQPAFRLNDESPITGAGLIVADEVSMLDERMARDLLSFGIKTIVLGDPAQLPPVKGSGYFTNREPDVMLTEVHRQAKDNPIIAMATEVREGRTLEVGTYGDSRVLADPSTEEKTSITLSADQLLVGRNATRQRSNKWFRLQNGRMDPLPLEGDKVVCLRNDHEVGLLNGGLWSVEYRVSVTEAEVAMTLVSEDDPGTKVDVNAHAAPFLGQEQAMDWRERLQAQEFDYGYAMTVHKAQGSQWRHVAIVDEWTWSGRQAWLYTALTRAQDKVTVFR
jgi:exodeoxyribonuclease-5